MWYRDGECYVHLYGQGESRRGPAFRLPLSALLEANCYPLLERFTATEAWKTHPSLEFDTGYHTQFLQTSNQPRLELYMTAPYGLDRQQTFDYHVVTRNFFAFIFHRSLIGQHLGTSLISLLDSMHEFRTADVDNLSDLIAYMDEVGYLDMKRRPTHALAILHFAEVFHIRDLYIEAFAHCCGMSDRIFLGPEFQVSQYILLVYYPILTISAPIICYPEALTAHLYRNGSETRPTWHNAEYIPFR